ncbi:uncharacterized protein LOC129611988 [Condylostylus longicornis]|uniref:uncharacterized protein LOC129611988 n=1 Tax=Condylostylus longicornis TaxID=2530218 RepID=UPI00244E1F09|nr:uncharacterized protein LOC129611988 [Condylostylus longicornis]
MATHAALKELVENHNETNLNSKFETEWETAKPYEKIPGPTRVQLLRWFMPGGKYHNISLQKVHKLMYKEYGVILKMPGFLGKRDVVLTFDPIDFEKVFRTEGTWPVRRGLDIIAYYRIIKQKELFEGAEGLTAVNGEPWAKIRTLANPVVMQPKTVRFYVDRMDNVASQFIKKIRSIRDQKTLEVPENFIQVINSWTMESVCVVALDKNLNLLSDPSSNSDARLLMDSMSVFFEMLYELDVKPSFWKYFPTKNFNKMMEAFDNVTNISIKYIDEAMEKLKNKKDLDSGKREESVLEKLLKINRKVAITMAMDLMLAGIDTTTSAFSACLLCLAKNPQKQEKLRKEILKILPNKDTPITNSNLCNLPYLRACIKESLRIHPVTVGNFRTTGQDLVLSGYRIPKDTDIAMPTAILYEDEDYFVESRKFIPERFLRKDQYVDDECPFSHGSGKSTNPFSYLPFGFGPRMCIGRRLVDLELEITLSKIIRNFKVEFDYSDENFFKTNIINVPNVPLKFKFIDIEYHNNKMMLVNSPAHLNSTRLRIRHTRLLISSLTIAFFENRNKTKKNKMLNSSKLLSNLKFEYKFINSANGFSFKRLLSAQAAIKKQTEDENLTDFQNEWNAAKPFEELPRPTKLQLIKWFLPGGLVANKPLHVFHKLLHDNFGEILVIPGLFGKKDLVLTFDPDDFRKVFRHEGIWPNRPGLDSMSHYRRDLRKDIYEGAEGLTTSFGEEWGRLRSIANPVLMQPKTIKIYVNRMNDVASDFLEKIRLIRDPSTLEVPDDFGEIITNWTLESVCVVALDTKLNLIKDPSKHPDALKLKEALRVFFDVVFDLDFKPSLWKYVATPKYNKFIKAMDTLTDITQKYAEEAYMRLQNNKVDDRDLSERSVLERLSKMDQKFGITMAMDLLFAGVDTTSSAFTAILASLAKNPDKQEILRKEILNILPEKDTPMTSERLKNLPYLRSCIKEGLRIHPVTAGNIRQVPEALVLGGYRIPKNTQVFMPFTLLYKDNSHFIDSSKFIPERWLREMEDGCPYSGGKGRSSNPFTYLPFGFGPRMCVGKRLVDMELEIALSKIIRNFKVEFNYPVDNLFRSNVINIPNIPLKFKFIDL